MRGGDWEQGTWPCRDCRGRKSKNVCEKKNSVFVEKKTQLLSTFEMTALFTTLSICSSEMYNYHDLAVVKKALNTLTESISCCRNILSQDFQDIPN